MFVSFQVVPEKWVLKVLQDLKELEVCRPIAFMLAEL
jgi:hypothetical protein